MNSRRRVLAALNHQQPDRVPVDFSSHRSSGIMAIAYARLKEHLGITSGNIYVYDMVQQLAIVEPPVLDRLGIDLVEMGRGFALNEDYWTDWKLPDGTPCRVPAYLNLKQEDGDWFILSEDGTPIAVQREGSLYFEQILWPLRGCDTDDFSDLEDHMELCMWTAVGSPPAPLDFEGEAVERGARRLRESTDRAIVGLFGGNLHEMGQFLFGIDEWMLMLAGDPERTHRFLDAVMQMHLESLRKFLQAVGPHIDVIMFGDDLGMQTGPQMSPAMYREFFQPRHAQLWDRARELADVHVMLHCCGGIYELLPALIDAGLDAINPVQISARGMKPKRLKQEFGQRMTFWGGGCDTHRVLPQASPNEIQEHVREMVDVMSPGGGFIFQQVHNIMSDVPPENVVAMFNAVNQ
jgi:uroporphyrinogen decarboxylase